MLKLSDKSISILWPPSYTAIQPKSSPDGSLILFAATRDGRSGIYTMSRMGENINRLTATDDDCRTPVWMGSTTSIIYSKNGGLYSLSLDIHQEVMLSNKGDSNPHWIGN